VCTGSSSSFGIHDDVLGMPGHRCACIGAAGSLSLKEKSADQLAVVRLDVSL
jgi:hypothetical protein